jgi:flagellar biosynthesis protein FlhB
MADPSKTEKPTGKRLGKARSEGRVARSHEVNQAAVLVVSVGVLAITGPKMLRKSEAIVGQGLAQSGSTHLVTGDAGLQSLFSWGLHSLIGVALPLVAVVAVTGVAASLAQVGLRFNLKSLKPTFGKLNPAHGLKRMFGPKQTVELGKSMVKLGIVGAAGASAVWTKVGSLGGLVGMPPDMLVGRIGSMVLSIAIRVAAVMIVVAALDYVWQKRQFMNSLKMTKDEVKREGREADLSPEVRGQIRKKQVEAARRRMLSDVPSADVVVVNPTHYAVALRYDGTKPAPELVAKGVDELARKIREIAEEAGISIVSAPPLARAIYRDVELGDLIPEEFFQAVAEILAFVFRTAGRRRRVA